MSNELTMSFLTALLVLVGIAQIRMLFSQKHQNQLALLQDYRNRWWGLKKQWARTVYVGRGEKDYYQVADQAQLTELEQLKGDYSLSAPTVWALESVRGVSNIFSDICIRILQGHLDIKDVYPIFGSELLRQGRPLRVLLDVYYPQDHDPMESRAHRGIRREVQNWLVYHDGIRRRCLILIDLLWAEGVRLGDICPTDIKKAAIAKVHTANKINNRLGEETRKVNGSMSLIRIVKLKSHLKNAKYRKGFWENGLDEVELDEREKKWEAMLLRESV
ncbi:hypothetical protein [Vibrio salilacus]|uniref:hypothetical protein n=1 Tax=Vibrio salilacus TaxID=1323749 RepID=UPI000C2AD0B2|nr:hypothetical protein [Vibrio salilacus]